MAEEAEAAPTKDWIATLRRGTRYVHKGVHFLSGVDVEVDEVTKDYLQKNAVDEQLVEGEFDEETGDPKVDKRPKFAFRKVGTAAPAPRRRGPVSR